MPPRGINRPSTLGLEPLTPNYAITVEDLSTLDDERIETLGLDAFPTLVIWLLRDARQPERLLDGLDHWVHVFIDLLEHPGGRKAIHQLFHYIMLVAGGVHFDTFREIIRAQMPETEDIAMTIAQQLRQEGRQEGRQDAGIQLLTTLLQAKFGALQPDHHAHIVSATLSQIQRYVARVPGATHLDQVFIE